MQRCAVTGVALPPSGLLRFVLDPADKLVLDLKQNLPTQTAIWLLPERKVVEQALKEKLFGTLAENASWPDDLADRIRWALEGRVVELLNLARRSGAVTGGLEKVRAALEKGSAVALLQAHDASEDGKRRLVGIAKGKEIPVITVLSRTSLGLVTGKENQVHLAIRAGGLAEQVISTCKRIEEYETGTAHTQ